MDPTLRDPFAAIDLTPVPQLDPVASLEAAPAPLPADEFAQEKAQAAQPLGFDHGLTAADDIIGAAVNAEWFTSRLSDMVGTEKGAPDFNWQPANMTPEQNKALNLAARPPEMVDDIFKNSVSFDHATRMMRAQDDRLKALNILDRAGTGGTVAQIAATLFDPVAIGVTIATDGAAAPLIIAGKAGRLARIVRTGALAGVSNAAIEQAMVAVDPLRHESDVAVAAAAGFALGGTLSWLTGATELEKLAARGKVQFGTDFTNYIAAGEAVRAGLPVTAPTMERLGRIVTTDEEGQARFITASTFAPDVFPQTPTRGPTSPFQWMLPEITKQGDTSPIGVPVLPHLEVKGPVTSASREEAEAALAASTAKIAKAEADAVAKREADAIALDTKLAKTIALRDATAHDITSHYQQSIVKHEAGDRAAGMLARELSDAAQKKLPELDKQIAALKLRKETQAAPVAPVATAEATPVHTVGGSVGAAGDKPNVSPMTTQSTEQSMGMWKKERVDKRDVSWQFDMYAFVARAKHDGLSWLMDKINANPSGVRKFTGRVQGRTVNEDKEMITKEVLGEAFRGYNRSFAEWAKEEGRGWGNLNTSARRDFAETVGLEVRNPQADASAAVKRAAQSVRDFHETFRVKAKEAHMSGFADLEANPGYLSRRVVGDKLKAQLDLHGESQVVDLVARALRNAPDRAKMTPLQAEAFKEEADRTAYLWVKWHRHSAWETDRGMSTAFNGAFVDQMTKKLEGAIAGDVKLSPEFRAALTPDAIAEFVDAMKNVGQHGIMARGKYRLTMNENEMANLPTGQIKLSDIFDNNAERLMERYASEMSGAVALARHPDLQIKSHSDWETLMTRMVETADTYHGNDHATFEKSMKIMELMRKHILGQPIHDLTARDSALFRMVRDYNFVRLGNRFGFAQFGEFGTMVGQLGYKAVVQHIPMLSSLRRDAITGKFDHEMVDWLDGLGIGIDHELTHPSMRDLDAADGTTQALARAEDVLSVGKRITSTISGLGPLTNTMERTAAVAVLQKLANIAHGSASLSKQRLMAMGLDEAGAAKVFENMRAHAGTTQSGFSGRKLKSLNINEWEPEARKLLETSVWRMTRRAIQRNDFGDLPLFMTKPMLQLMFQFRSFTFAAWAKQTLHGARMADMQSVTTAIHSTVFAGASYIAMTYAASLGRDDAEAYRAERLSPDKVALMAASRTGWSSMVPAAVDTGLNFVGHPEIFAPGRTTGQNNSFITGSPTVSLLQSAYRAGQGAVNAAIPGRSFSVQNARDLKALGPFQNFLGYSNAQEWLMKDLPKQSRFDN